MRQPLRERRKEHDGESKNGPGFTARHETKPYPTSQDVIQPQTAV